MPTTVNLLSPEQLVELFDPLVDASQAIYIGFSGGVDSTALLHALGSLPRYKTNLKALHVNHQMHPESARWAAHCAAFCGQMNIPIQIDAVQVVAAQGPEADARSARYRVFETLLKDGGQLLSAHHADDQLETLMFRLITGASAKSMAGIRRQRPLAKGVIMRPLLGVSRQQLIAYCQRHQLPTLDDPSNQDPALARGYLRKHILPQIYQFKPKAAQAASRLADQLQTLSYATDSRLDATNDRLALLAWRDLDPSAQLQVLADFFSQHLRINQAMLKSQQQILNRLARDQKWCLKTDDGEFRVYRDFVYFVRAARVDKHELKLSVNAQYWNGQRLDLNGLHEQRIVYDLDKAVFVRAAPAGLRLRAIKQAHAKPFKDWCQHHAIPPWRRKQVPILYQDDQLIGVYGYGAFRTPS